MGDFTDREAFYKAPLYPGSATIPPAAARRPESLSMQSHYGSIGGLIPEKPGLEAPGYRKDVSIGLTNGEDHRWLSRKDSAGFSSCGSECSSMDSTAPALRQLLGVRRSSLLLMVYMLFYISYLATGGLVFSAMEEPLERSTRLRVESAKDAFLQKNPCVTGRNGSMSVEANVRVSMTS
ncbi:hypothetical protein J437_LFUL019678 [Ladona fulva]|nr:hypothetical protein J437_LFUL019678 [Ladona fulva]